MKKNPHRWLRQNFGFSVSSGILVGIYLVAVTAISYLLITLITTQLDSRPQILGMAITVTVAAVLYPLRIHSQKRIDRTFFRNTFDYKKSISEFAQTASSNIHLSNLLQELFRQLNNWMGISSGLIYLKHSDEDDFFVLDEFYGLAASDQQLLPAIVSSDELFTFLSKGVFLPLETAGLSSRAADILKKIGTVLVVPFYIKEKLVGILCLGRKRSKLDYDADDLQLLSTVTNQCSVAIENALAYRRIQEINQTLEVRVRDRMAELIQTVEHLKQTQNQLLVSEKMASLGRMVTGVVHQIKDPLTIISVNAETFQTYVEMIPEMNQLGEQLDSTDPLRRSWEEEKENLFFDARMKHAEKMSSTTHYGVDRIKKIISDLSKFARSEQEEFLPVQINRFIRQVVAAFPLPDPQSVEFHLDLKPIPEFPGLEVQIVQMIFNVIENAVEALREHGEIWIETRQTDTSIQIQIRDNGRGISIENLPKIFDPFFTTKKIGQGTGLGLSVVYGIVKKHEGHINITSELNQGTTVNMDFPMNR